MNALACPICKTPLSEPSRRFGGAEHGESFECPRCGSFGLSDGALTDLERERPSDRQSAALSHHARRVTASGPRVLHGKAIETIMKDPVLPTPAEQADYLILHIGESTQPGNGLAFRAWEDGAIIGASTMEGFLFVGDGLAAAGLVESWDRSHNAVSLRLTFAGWERFEGLKRGRSDSRRAFMAMQYGDALLDRVYGECFKPAVERAGFSLFRLDERPEAGLIDNRMRVDIRASRFLIADITNRNPGAYWEAGFAEGLGKPVIYTCERSRFSEHKHFDVEHHYHVLWDADKLDAAQDELATAIRATLPSEARISDEEPKQ